MSELVDPYLVLIMPCHANEANPACEHSPMRLWRDSVRYIFLENSKFCCSLEDDTIWDTLRQSILLIQVPNSHFASLILLQWPLLPSIRNRSRYWGLLTNPAKACISALFLQSCSPKLMMDVKSEAFMHHDKLFRPLLQRTIEPLFWNLSWRKLNHFSNDST